MTAVQQAPAAEAPAGVVATPGRARISLTRPRRRSRGAAAPRAVPVSVVAWMLAALGALVAWTIFWAVGVSVLQAGHQQGVLYSKLREQLSLQTAPLGGAITPGAPVALLNFPAAGVHQLVVVEGTAPRDLMGGPGHRRDTPLPGQAGVSVVYGRSTLFGGPFAQVGTVHAGDAITATTGQGTFTYKVIGVRHAGDPFPPALAPGAGRLTLVTVESGSWRNGWAPGKAMYVDAALAGDTVPTPDGRPASVPRAELAMHGDSSALLPVVLWLPVLAVAVTAVVVAAERWGRWQAWLVGVPVVLGALWGVSQSVVQLLPNLM